MGRSSWEKEFDALEVTIHRWAEKNNVPINQKEAISTTTLSELIAREETGNSKPNSVKNSRCVSVDTISPAPDDRRKKKKSFKGRNQLVKFRCTTYEKKLLAAKAKLCGLSLSEYLRRAAMTQTTVERLSDEEIEIYQMLAKYHNNFKSIGNMFRKKSPKLTEMVYETAKQIKEHLKRFSK